MRHFIQGIQKNRSVLIVLLLAAVSAGFLGVRLWERWLYAREAELFSSLGGHWPVKWSVKIDGVKYSRRPKTDLCLLIGLDKMTDTASSSMFAINNQQNDFLLLLAVDHNNKTCSALHINRDTMTDIQELGLRGDVVRVYQAQLALAHTYGRGGKDSCRNTVKAVSDYLYGIPIDHYASIMMDGIPVLNDMVGGVTVFIEDDFSKIDPAMKQGTEVLLRGQQALTFIRSRMSVADGTNLNRMNRQRVYMYSLYHKLRDELKSKDGFALKFVTELSDYMVSDMTVTVMSELANKLPDYEFQGIFTIDGEAKVGKEFVEFYSDEASLNERLIQLFLVPSRG